MIDPCVGTWAVISDPIAPIPRTISLWTGSVTAANEHVIYKFCAEDKCMFGVFHMKAFRAGPFADGCSSAAAVHVSVGDLFHP